MATDYDGPPVYFCEGYWYFGHTWVPLEDDDGD